jgi:hypothetical protein
MSPPLAVMCCRHYSLKIYHFYVNVLSHHMLWHSMLFLENIFFLCNCLKPSYVMTFNVIPIFFSFSNATKNNIDIRPGPKKSWNYIDKLLWQDLYLSSRAQINYCSWVFLKYTFLTHKNNWKMKNGWTYFCWKYTNKCVSNKPSQKNSLQF